MSHVPIGMKPHELHGGSWGEGGLTRRWFLCQQRPQAPAFSPCCLSLIGEERSKEGWEGEEKERKGEGNERGEERKRRRRETYIPTEIVFECFIICSGLGSTLVNGVSDDGTNL